MSTAIERAPSEGRRNEWIGVMALTVILVASVIWHPHDEGGFVFCLIRRFTGLPCPGCGLTRSFCALAKGDVARSFGFHWLGPLLFVMACCYWVRGVAAVAGFDAGVARFDALVAKWRVGPIVVVLMLVVWIVRLALLLR